MDFSKKVPTFHPSRKLQGKFRRGGQHCIHWDNRISMQTVFLKNTFFLPILYFERNISSFSLETLRRDCNHCIRRVQRNIMRKNKNLILRKTLKFYTILGDCEDNFGVVVNAAFTEAMGSLCRSVFLKIYVFLPFFHLERNISGGLSSKPRQQSFNQFILCVHGDVLRKNKKWIFRKKYKLFILHGNCNGSFGEVVNTAFTETIGSLCRPFSWNIRFFTSFVLRAKNFQLFVENSSPRL